MKEPIRVAETLTDGNGKLLASCNAHEIIGEVEIIYRSKRNGKQVFTRKLKRNDLLVTGAVFLSEKVNNIRSTFVTTPVDISLGVHSAEDLDQSDATIPLERICGIMVGNGGCGDTYNTVHKVKRTDYTVPGPVPFRVVPRLADLKGAARERYMLRVPRGEYVYYYGKKFTVSREINVQYEDGTIVPTNVNILGDNKGQYIRTFTKFLVTLDETDIREYFKLTEGNTLHSLVNSVGLITGYPGAALDDPSIEEFFNVRTMTTLNTENDELKDSEATITYVYRLYFV